MTDEEEAPKSALEIAMARLKKKDEDAGVAAEAPITEEQRAAIAEARQVAEARLAEQEILHRSKRARVDDPDALEALEMEYRRDRERIVSDRDRKIGEVRLRSPRRPE